MKIFSIRIDVFHHIGNDTFTPLLERLDAMTPQLETLRAEVEETKGLVQSNKALLQGLSAMILSLKDDPAAIEALAAELAVANTEFADAITANTPTE